MNLNPAIRQEKKKHSCVCATSYSPISHEMKTIIKKHWDVLSADPVCKKLFADPPLFSHYRAKNVRDNLVRADTTIQSVSTQKRIDRMTGFFPCRNCTACENSKRAYTFTSHVTSKTYDIRQCLTCNAAGVVYLVSCPCGLQYIGKTLRPVRTRIIEHKSAIQIKDLKSPIARHFIEANHPLSTLSFCVIEQINKTRRGGDIDRKLLKAESRWIFYMKSLHPDGLNEDLTLSCSL